MKKIYAFCLAFFSMAGIARAQQNVVIPTSGELILPQYAYWGGTTNAHRIPFVCRLTLTGLAANATYRFQSGMSSNPNLTALPTTGQQAPGHMYRIINTAGTYGHIVGLTVNKSTAGNVLGSDILYTIFTTSYSGSFTTDASGSYTGWFSAVPTGSSAASGQNPKGGDVYFYVQISGAGNTTFSTSLRTTSTIKLLDYSSVANDPAGCTPLLGTSDVGNEKMVVIYDNTTATGRPLYCTFTENNNCAACSPAGQLTESASLYTNPIIYGAVDGVSGSWAAIIPNTLTGGVKAINYLNIADATPITLSTGSATNTSADGIWNGVSTANPAGDSTRPIVINSIQGTLLPVNMLSFKGVSAKEGIKLIWTTSQEINNRHFEIMRAGRDGRYQAIGRVNAMEMPGLLNEYSYIDRQPLNGINFYQLKQVDKDGTTTLSKVITVDNQNARKKMMRVVSQNPAELVVGITADDAAAGRLMFSDASGRILYSKQVTLTAGENAFTIPVAQTALQMGVLTFSSAKGDMMQLKIIR